LKVNLRRLPKSHRLVQERIDLMLVEKEAKENHEDQERFDWSKGTDKPCFLFALRLLLSRTFAHILSILTPVCPSSNQRRIRFSIAFPGSPSPQVCFYFLVLFDHKSGQAVCLRIYWLLSPEQFSGPTEQLRPLVSLRRSVLHNQEFQFDSTFAQALQHPIMWTLKGRSETVTSGSRIKVERRFCIFDSHGCKVKPLLASNTTRPLQNRSQPSSRPGFQNSQFRMTVPR
jgi:hypothetical protein